MKAVAVMFALVLVGGTVRADESKEKVKEAHVLARMAPEADTKNNRFLFLYSKEKLLSVGYLAQNDVVVSMPFQQKMDPYFVYRTQGALPSKEGDQIVVRGLLPNGDRFDDLLTLKKDSVDVSGRESDVLLGRLGEKDANKNQKIFIYSKERFSSISYQTINDYWSPLKEHPAQGGYFIYGSEAITIPEGKRITIRIGRSWNEAVTDVVTAKAEDDFCFDGRENAMTVSEIYNGSPYFSPQQVAEARINYQVTHNVPVHFGNAGCLMTNVGSLSEGWGKGGPNPYTCHGDGYCYADAQVRTADGWYQRLRFYAGGTHP